MEQSFNTENGFESLEGSVEYIIYSNEENGYTVLERKKDFNDRERAVLAQYGRKDENYGDEKNGL